MSPRLDATALAIFLALFAVVTVMGFLAARWRRAGALNSLDQWGLGGRGFGGFVSWFLLGGDLYTACTAAVVGGSPARVRHPGRFRPGALRLPRAGVGGRLYRDPGADALHRAAVGRYSIRAAGDGGRSWPDRPGQGPPAHHRIRNPGGLYLHLRVAGARPHRVRQRCAGLRRGDRGRHLHSAAPARVRPYLRGCCGARACAGGCGESRRQTADVLADPGAEGLLGLRDARAGFRPLAVHVPALHYRRTGYPAAGDDPAQLGAATAVLAGAGRYRVAGIHGHRGGREDHQSTAGRAGAVPRHVPQPGSPVSPTRLSRSVPSCRQRSCRSPPRTCSPATSIAT